MTSGEATVSLAQFEARIRLGVLAAALCAAVAFVSFLCIVPMPVSVQAVLTTAEGKRVAFAASDLPAASQSTRVAVRHSGAVVEGRIAHVQRIEGGEEAMVTLNEVPTPNLKALTPVVVAYPDTTFIRILIGW